ncbi:hypothetical protein [Globicatella sanguinis]
MSKKQSYEVNLRIVEDYFKGTLSGSLSNGVGHGIFGRSTQLC